jgi:hypothetical protein
MDIVIQFAAAINNSFILLLAAFGNTFPDSTSGFLSPLGFKLENTFTKIN